MKLIDADMLYRKVKTKCNPYGKPSIGFEDGCKTLDIIVAEPVVDAVPVVHARWIDSPNIPECVVCSNCMSDELSAQVLAPAPVYYRFCPCCGARMGGEDDDKC